jgi:hypothetical protein
MDAEKWRDFNVDRYITDPNLKSAIFVTRIQVSQKG